MFSAVGGYHGYTRGYHDECGDIMSTAGGAQYTGGYHEYTGGAMMSVGGYHEYTRRCSVHWGFHTNSIVFQQPSPTLIMIFPGVLMISPGVLNTSQCAHDIPHCTHDTPRCTEHSPLYCTPLVYCTDILQGECTHDLKEQVSHI